MTNYTSMTAEELYNKVMQRDENAWPELEKRQTADGKYYRALVHIQNELRFARQEGRRFECPLQAKVLLCASAETYIPAFDKLREMDPKHPDLEWKLPLRLGNHLTAEKEYEKALWYFEKVGDLKFENSLTHTERCQVLQNSLVCMQSQETFPTNRNKVFMDRLKRCLSLRNTTMQEKQDIFVIYMQWIYWLFSIDKKDIALKQNDLIWQHVFKQNSSKDGANNLEDIYEYFYAEFEKSNNKKAKQQYSKCLLDWAIRSFEGNGVTKDENKAAKIIKDLVCKYNDVFAKIGYGYLISKKILSDNEFSIVKEFEKIIDEYAKILQKEHIELMLKVLTDRDDSRAL